jgi:hypothetical protein
VWRRIAETIANSEPFKINPPSTSDIVGVALVVDKIIEQFRFLIEDRRLSEELYHEGKPRIEKAVQRLFFAVAYAYCKANNLDITPEADTGNGPVDFKMSQGFKGRVLVEIKLSVNNKLIEGYSRQLRVYEKAEETVRGYYLVINVGGLGKKYENLLALKTKEEKEGGRTSSIVLVDGLRRLSASKL